MGLFLSSRLSCKLRERAGSGGSTGGVERVASSRQEFGNAPRRMVSDAGEHVGDIVLRVEASRRKS